MPRDWLSLADIGTGVCTRQREGERRTLVRDPYGPHAASMPLDDPLDVGEPDARSRELVLAVQALEDPEELVHVLRIEARAVVPDEDRRSRAVVGRMADLDARL